MLFVLFLFAHFSKWASWVLCFFSVLHWVMLHLILLSYFLYVDINRKGLELLMDIICVVSFMFTSKIEFSESCVFLKKFAQCGCSHVQNVVPCWFVEKRIGCWWVSFVYLLFCVHHSNRVLWVLCLSLTIHPVTLLRCQLCCCLLIKNKKFLLLVNFVLRAFCIYSSIRVQRVRRLSSAIHSMLWLRCSRSCCLLIG